MLTVFYIMLTALTSGNLLMEIVFIPSTFSLSQMAVWLWCPTITEWMMDVQWTMTPLGIHIPPLITMTSAVSLPPFGLELILSVGGAFSDVLSQTDHNCFFIIVACCSTAKTWQTWKSRRDHFTLHITNTQTKTHTFSFCCVPSYSGLVYGKPPSGWVS